MACCEEVSEGSMERSVSRIFVGRKRERAMYRLNGMLGGYQTNQDQLIQNQIKKESYSP